MHVVHECKQFSKFSAAKSIWAFFLCKIDSPPSDLSEGVPGKTSPAYQSCKNWRTLHAWYGHAWNKINCKNLRIVHASALGVQYQEHVDQTVSPDGPVLTYAHLANILHPHKCHDVLVQQAQTSGQERKSQRVKTLLPALEPSKASNDLYLFLHTNHMHAIDKSCMFTRKNSPEFRHPSHHRKPEQPKALAQRVTGHVGQAWPFADPWGL